jgi:hypothetical protein
MEKSGFRTPNFLIIQIPSRYGKKHNPMPVPSGLSGRFTANRAFQTTPAAGQIAAAILHLGSSAAFYMKAGKSS